MTFLFRPEVTAKKEQQHEDELLVKNHWEWRYWAIILSGLTVVIVAMVNLYLNCNSPACHPEATRDLLQYDE